MAETPQPSDRFSAPAAHERTQKLRTTGPMEQERPTEIDLTGRKIDDFLLLRRLGRGGMAEVYLAEQLSLKRQVAFKVLRSDLAADAVYVRRLHAEAEAAAKLNHPHIVQIYAVGQQAEIHYIAQEYVQGQNLKELLARRGALDWQDATRILRQAALALGRAARERIVHRDIKPENILLTRDGDVKVADFGLARQLQPDKPLDLTQVGVTMGTPLYMSPEQVQAKPLDHRSDLYSLGVTAYHMLAGQPPFRGDTALAVAVQHVKGRPAPLAQLRPDLPPALGQIVERMMAKDPARRYDSADALVADLDRLLTADPSAAATVAAAAVVTEETTATRQRRQNERAETIEPSGPPAVSPRRLTPRRLWACYALCLVAALAAGAGLGWLRRQPDLFAEAARKPLDVPKQQTVLAQFFWANQLNSEAAWKAVIEYFPNERYHVLRAKQNLAYLYLLDNRREEAGRFFDELANLPDADRPFRAFGLAGQAVLLSLEGSHQQSNLLLAQLLPQRQLLDPHMLALVREALASNERHQRDQTSKDWRDFFEREFAGDAEPPANDD